AAMAAYILGLDVGTTSVKAVLLDPRTRTAVETRSVSVFQAKEQDPGRIIDALNRSVGLLSADKRNRVRAVSVCGQMHGLLLWKPETGCDWSTDAFTPSDTSQLITWQDGRCDSAFLSTLPPPQSHVSVATGFGCATIFWFLKHRPDFLDSFSVAGTVQDYVVSMLCGLDVCVMTPQNAASWGFYDNCVCVFSSSMSSVSLQEAGFPVRLLPRLRPSGTLAGRTRSQWNGVPMGTAVGVALGDFQCSVYSCMNQRTDLTYCDAVRLHPSPVSQPDSAPLLLPVFDSSYLGGGASLNGGNVLATFVETLAAWTKELGAELSSSSFYEKLIGCALNQETTDLRVSPTLLGERHAPFHLGQVTNISASNLSLGHVTRALCRGVVENLTSMMPAESLRRAGVRKLIGSGAALARNQVLRQEVERAFPLPVVYRQNADSALGAAMAICDHLQIGDDLLPQKDEAEPKPQGPTAGRDGMDVI
uniref:Sedoheptulokinase n=1 Tax=Sphaeramia orbicularis TaxID=375764 RepID=A0A673B3G8_9TELE